MKEVEVYEAKARLSKLLAAVEAGEEVLITRGGAPVARLMPAHSKAKGSEGPAQLVAEIFASLERDRQGVSLDLPLRRVIEHGRD